MPHTPAGAFDPAVFQPIAGDITCQRCLRSPSARAAAAPAVDENQMDLLAELDDDPEES